MATAGTKMMARKGQSVSPRPANQADEETYVGRFAARLRELRSAKRLTVEDLAERITRAGYKVTTPTIYSWEQGRSTPHVESFPALAEALGLKSPRQLIPSE